MTDFVISDTHWGHDKIIQYTKRPFEDIDEMTQQMMDKWNARVGPGDTIIHLGDVVSRVPNPVEYAYNIVSQLNGYKILIPGNHEEGLSDSEMLEEGFDEVHPYLEFRGFFMIHRPQNAFDLNTKGLPVLHGHKHIETPVYLPEWGVNMSCEYWNYEPVTFEEIEEKLSFWESAGSGDEVLTPPTMTSSWWRA